VQTDLRHVHVVEKDDQTLAVRRTVDVLGAFLDVCLEVPLDVQRGGPAGEVDVE